MKPMLKTFTLVVLLLTTTVLFPNTLVASTNAVESACLDAKFGEKDLIKFYPNPMVTDATVKVSEEVDLERNKVSIVFYNIVGTEVYKLNQVKDYEVKIYRDLFKNAGIYFYQLMVDESVMSTGRITVK